MMDDPYLENHIPLSANALATAFRGAPVDVSCGHPDCDKPATRYLFMGPQACDEHDLVWYVTAERSEASTAPDA